MPSKWVRDMQMKHHHEHMERIRKMQPVVDNKKPRELPMSGKKEIERRRFRDKVEKGNRLLLDRLGKALERKNIDNERKPIKFNSLEQGKKKLELARVTMENQLLLDRINAANPMYDHHQWERDAAHREFYLKNMTEFPELYVPHYPPERKKFLKAQAKKKKEAEMAKAEKDARKKAARQGIPFSPSMVKQASSPEGAEKTAVSVSPPSFNPPGGVVRPEGIPPPHYGSPTRVTDSIDKLSSQFQEVTVRDHALSVVPTEVNGETFYSNNKGEQLLHGVNTDGAFYTDSHHIKFQAPTHHTAPGGGFDELRVNTHSVEAGHLPAPYQGGDSHGQGVGGVIGGLETYGVLEAAQKEERYNGHS